MRGSRLAVVSAPAIFVVIATVPLSSAGELASGEKAQRGTAGHSTPLSPLRGGGTGGTATIRRIGDGRGVEIKATLQPSRRDEAYQVWLYNSRRDSRSLGAQVTDRRGRFMGAGPLPPGSHRYRYIDISRERIKGGRQHSGRSVLRGPVPAARTVGPARGIVEIPGIARLSYVCDSSGRSSTTLSVPRRSATVTVATHSDGRRLWRDRRVDPPPPGGALATPFERVRRQRWRIVSRHEPSTIEAFVSARFDVERCSARRVVTDVTTRPN